VWLRSELLILRSGADLVGESRTPEK